MANINEEKYKNTVLFFANKIWNGTLGKLKLMKLLYFLDFDFFEKNKKSVTGDVYLRFDNGPVPRMAEKLLKEMKDSDIRIVRKPMGSGLNDQQQIQPLKTFDLNYFSKEELLMMEEIADKWEKLSGTEIKTASHSEDPWIATKPNEIIDYNLVFYRNKYGEIDEI